eukprot:gene17404-biopygen12811
MLKLALGFTVVVGAAVGLNVGGKDQGGVQQASPVTTWVRLLLQRCRSTGAGTQAMGTVSHGVVVSTQDSESCDRGSNPRGRTFARLTKQRARPGSNQGPFGLRPNALPLSYVPTSSIGRIG